MLNSKKVISIIVLLFIVFALAPDFVSVSGNSLKLMYYMFVILVVITLSKKRIVLPNKFLIGLLGIMILVSLVEAFQWEINKLLFNYCFGFCIITIFLTLCSDFSRKEWESIFQKAWVILLVFVIINDLRQGYRFVEYIQYKLGHPYIQTVVSGGVNLEATWLGILSLSFFHTKKRWISPVISTFISLVYSSRVGIIANVIVILFFIFGIVPKDTKKKILNRRFAMSIAVVGATIVLFIYGSEQLLVVLNRFKDIGIDAGSIGRLAMWKYFIPLLMKYPMGVGLGNVMDALESISHLRYTEDNIHNLYMQMFIELGILGGIIYLFSWIVFFKREMHNFIKEPITGMVLIYGILAMFQFKGGETIFFCIVAAYLCLKKKDNKSKESLA